MATLPPLRQMIDELVAIPSVSSVDPTLDTGNRPVVDRLAEWAEGLGFRCEVRPVPGARGKANLIATLGAGGDGLVLSGHTDTVPFDETGWSSDPFRVEERSGRLYGLGTCDMKGFLALALEAARDLDPARLERPLVLLATADEESGMDGVKALAAEGQAPGRHVVIGEPTGLRPVRMHKGVMMESVRLTGRSGHSSDPTLGINAMDAMSRVLDALIAWREDLAVRYRDERFRVPCPTVNLGRIRGGDNPNRICASCELHFDIRTLPGMDNEAVRDELHRQLARALEGFPGGVEMAPVFPGQPAMETAADAPVVRAAEALTGHPAESVAFATEAPWLSRLGMDVVVIGPADIAQAHQPDEFLAMDRLQPTLDLLGGLIDRFCLRASESAP